MSVQFGFGAPGGSFNPQKIFSQGLGFGGFPQQPQPVFFAPPQPAFGFPQQSFGFPQFQPPQNFGGLGLGNFNGGSLAPNPLQQMLANLSPEPLAPDLSSLLSPLNLGPSLKESAFQSQLEKGLQFAPVMAQVMLKTPTLIKENFNRNNPADRVAAEVLFQAFTNPLNDNTGSTLIKAYLDVKAADLADDNKLNGSDVGDANPPELRLETQKVQQSFYKLDKADDGEINGSFVDTIQAEILTRQLKVENKIIEAVGLENSPFDIGFYGLDANKIHARELAGMVEGIGLKTGGLITKGVLVDELEHRKAVKEDEDKLTGKLSAADYQQNQDINARTIQVIEFLLENFDKLAKADGQRGLTLIDLIFLGDKAVDKYAQLKDPTNRNALVTADIINDVLKS